MAGRGRLFPHCSRRVPPTLLRLCAEALTLCAARATLAQVQNQHHYPIAPWFRTLFVASQSLLGPETGWNQHDTASEASFGASKRCSWVT